MTRSGPARVRRPPKQRKSSRIRIMTEYELLDLWIALLEFAVTVVVAFLSATSALLIVAHLKGPELSLVLFRMISAVYCVAATFFLIMYGKTSEGALNVRGQMQAAGMDWHNTVYEPQLIAPLVLTIGFIVQLLLAIGAMWYFRSTRTD